MRHLTVVVRQKQFAWVAALTVVLVPLGGCSGTLEQALGTCEGKEQDVMPHLEKVAEEALRGVDKEFSDYSGCVLDGEYGPAVIADVPNWRKRSVANAHLVGHGWTRTDFVHFLSPDARFDAHVVMGSAEGVPLHADVRFEGAD